MYNNTDIKWCVQMPPDPSFGDPKVEMPLELCKEEDIILEATYSMIDDQFSHWDW